MEINGTFTDEELIKYISMNLKLELIKNIAEDNSFSVTERLIIITSLFKEDKE